MSEPLRKSDPPADVSMSAPHVAPRIVLIDRDHPQRAEVERFIEGRFWCAYGARLQGHYDLIGALTGDDGAIVAAAGVRLAEDEPLFLEQYLDDPIEAAVARAFGRPVARDSVVEIGGLAADGAASALALFGGLAEWLARDCGRRFAVATARPELQRLLDRSGFGLRHLGCADPARLEEPVGEWGSYYDAGPCVFAGEIGQSSALAQLRERLRAKSMARQARRALDATR